MIPVFTTALMGIVIGAIGNVIMPARDTGGRVTSAVLGLCGASLTASIGWLQGFWDAGALLGYVAGAGGSVLLLIIYRLIVSQDISVEIK
jgi:uncharacterized membrane protein YeaQ/YmgE (transglycosylase-associated protein family)